MERGGEIRIQQLYEERARVDREGNQTYQATRVVIKLYHKHLNTCRRFLDVGCGMGAGTIAIARELGCREVFGVDFVQAYLRDAQARGVHTFHVDLDSDALPFEDDFFDAILCSEVIEHVVDSDHVLREIRRVLSPDGVCVIATPNLASWIDRLALFFFGWQPFSTSTSFGYDVGRPRFLSDRTVGKHLRVLTYRGLIELLRLHGFDVIDIRGARAFTVQDLVCLVREQHKATAVGLLRVLLTFAAVLLDWFAVFRPRLAPGLVAAVRKGRNLEGLLRASRVEEGDRGGAA